MTTRKPKKFDCVAMKEAAQREIVARIEGLTPEQEIARIRKDVEDGPLGDWWKSLPKDPGPQPEVVPVGGGTSRKR